MRALTIKQPWADAITHGTKRVENRTWNTNYRGPILIHAGAAYDKTAIVYGHQPNVRSAIIATADITDCHFDTGAEPCCSEWAHSGVYHWQLANVRPLAEPVPCNGRLGLWTPMQEVQDTVRAQLAEVTR